MTRDEAKAALALYRPSGGDAGDPQIGAALALARRDPELARWLEGHSALHAVVREKFRQIQAPAGLQARLVAGRAAARKIIWFQRPALLTAAAAFVLLLGLAAFWLRSRDAHRLADFRVRMARTALRPYNMNMVTNDLNQIREYLRQNQAHGDYVLTKNLEKLPGDGCAILRWHNRRVSLVCFDLGHRQDLYLFVINRADLSDPPAAGAPRLARVGKLMTASWSDRDKTYLLAGAGDEAFLRKYL